jgi:hypothetical protein
VGSPTQHSCTLASRDLGRMRGIANLECSPMVPPDLQSWQTGLRPGQGASSGAPPVTIHSARWADQKHCEQSRAQKVEDGKGQAEGMS